MQRGRIEVDIKSSKGKSQGMITIASRYTLLPVEAFNEFGLARDRDSRGLPVPARAARAGAGRRRPRAARMGRPADALLSQLEPGRYSSRAFLNACGRWLTRAEGVQDSVLQAAFEICSISGVGNRFTLAPSVGTTPGQSALTRALGLVDHQR